MGSCISIDELLSLEHIKNKLLMKRFFLSLVGVMTLFAASAQFSVGVNANYTMYKADFQKSTPGAQVRASYAFTEKSAAVLSFTYGMPIKTPSSVTMIDNMGNPSSASSEIRYNFKTFNLLGHYTFVGGDGAAGKFYGIAGAGYVLVNYKEVIKDNYDKSVYTPTDQVNGSESGFTINFGLGGEYRFGAPAVFGEVGVGLPANQQNGQYVENVIPTHIIINLGVKFSFGNNGE